jgi:hypothetical protein
MVHIKSSLGFMDENLALKKKWSLYSYPWPYLNHGHSYDGPNDSLPFDGPNG